MADPERAEAVIQFIENLTIPSGVGQGTNFRLREWQKKFVREIYSPHYTAPDGRLLRRVRRAILSIARKNGKTALIAALVLAHLVGPEAVVNGEVYSAANDREQAAQVFKFARQIVEADEELSEMIRVIPSTKTLACYSNGSFYRALSAESGTKHGLNPTFAVYDELAQAKSRELFDVLDTSFGGREEPLFAVISTQSNDPTHILSTIIDDGLNPEVTDTVCHLYEIPEKDDVFDPSNWRKANPALGDFRSLEDLRALAEKAARLPGDEPKFRNLYCNQRVSPISSLISRAEWTACGGEGEIPAGAEVYLALDLSAVVDLCALVAVQAGPHSRVAPFIWKPADLLEEHSKRDFGKGENRYQKWADDGVILTSPGKSIDPEVVARKVIECCQKWRVLGLAYDRWRIKDLQREFDDLQFATYVDTATGDDTAPPAGSQTGLRMVPWGQGYRDMAPAVDALELEITERTLIHPKNPALTWTVGNAVAHSDPAGNRKIDKEKVRFRIDPAVAMTMGLGLKSRDRKKASRQFQVIVV